MESTTTSPEREPFECDIFAQDCPVGQRCVFWAEDGGASPNTTRCMPLTDDPGDVDEPCRVEPWGTFELDDCGLGLMCLYVDPETMEGICVPLCVGDPSNVYCEDPNRYCLTGGSGWIIYCVRICDPLVQDCAEGQACHPHVDTWLCLADASGEMGVYGDSCWFVNACDPGLICLDDGTVPPGQPCEGTGSCCTEVCDLSDPAGDLQCAGAAEGQTCQAWYQAGTAPAGYENVGACALPQ